MHGTEQPVVLSYRPRRFFEPFHRRTKKKAVIVAHRSAGKTEACLNELLWRALKTKKQNARYAYIGPFASQAYEVAWDRLKRCLPPGLFERCDIKESAHSIKLPNGSLISIFGADKFDNLRGLRLDGVIMDEVADMHPDAWPLVIAPTLIQQNGQDGWVVFIGTPKGTSNFFYEQREKARRNLDDSWFYLELPNSKTQFLSDEQLSTLRDELDEDEFLQEVECSFDAAVKGTYYAKQLIDLEAAGKLQPFDFVKGAPVHLAFDLGYEDATACWFFQVVNGRLDVIDHWEENHLSIKEIAEEVVGRAQAMGYRLGNWWLPHDAKHKSIQTGKNIVELLLKEGIHRSVLRIAPDEKVYQGIQAVRATLPLMRIHGVNCYSGLEALKAYRKKENKRTGTFSKEPLHDWTSHTADAMRYLCLAIRDEDISASAAALTAPTVSSWHSRAANHAPPALNRSHASLTFDDLWATRSSVNSDYIY